MKDLVLKQTYKWEYDKGVTNNPNDTGGATNDGITYTHYQQYCQEVLGIMPHYEHFKAMSFADIMKFYNRVWVRLGCDKIKNEVLAGLCFDFAFNSGNGKREIQEVLQRLGYKIQADNVFGPQTIMTLNQAFEAYKADLIDLILIARLTYVSELVYTRRNQVTFIQGWFNRIADWRLFAKQHLQYK
jgi:lysozyme family protein